MESANDVARKRFARFAWVVLAFNIPVILWGAFVRVSYSGDGCGAHWPFCNGQALPQNMTKPTLIEFTHRMMTSVDTLLVLALVGLAFWLYPKRPNGRSAVRRYALLSFGFLLVEALLGAGLVMFRMVAHNQSAGRVWYLSAHLINTMLLLAALTLTAWLASGGSAMFRIRDAKPALLWSAMITVFISITGAVAALGDMLFPTGSLIEGMQRDLSSASPLLLRLRMTHPVIAVLGSAWVIWSALPFLREANRPVAHRAAVRLISLVIFQMFWGAANLSLLAPVWMQLTHLLIADLVWMALVVMVAESATEAQPVMIMPVAGFSARETAARNPAYIGDS
jgi:heme A synthase